MQQVRLTFAWLGGNTTQAARGAELDRAVTGPSPRLAEKNRGFGFVEFEDTDDAKAAMDNMNSASRAAASACARTAVVTSMPASAADAELYGRVLTVNVAKPMNPTSFNKPGARAAVGALLAPAAHSESSPPDAFPAAVWAEADEWWKKTLQERGTEFEGAAASDADLVPSKGRA